PLRRAGGLSGVGGGGLSWAGGAPAEGRCPSCFFCLRRAPRFSYRGVGGAPPPPPAPRGPQTRAGETRGQAGGPAPPTERRTDRSRECLPLHAVARLGSERLRHGGIIWAVRFAPNGKTLASAGTDHSIRLWDAVTGRSVAVFAEPGAVSDPYLPSRWLFCLA